MTTVADAIRSKTGGSDPLSFPAGISEALEGISGGGGPTTAQVQLLKGATTQSNPAVVGLDDLLATLSSTELGQWYSIGLNAGTTGVGGTRTEKSILATQYLKLDAGDVSIDWNNPCTFYGCHLVEPPSTWTFGPDMVSPYDCHIYDYMFHFADFMSAGTYVFKAHNSFLTLDVGIYGFNSVELIDGTTFDFSSNPTHFKGYAFQPAGTTGVTL